MKLVSVVALLSCPGGVLLGWGQQRNQSGVRIGTSGGRQLAAGSGASVGGRGGSGIKLGSAAGGKSLRNLTRPAAVFTAAPPPPPQVLPPPLPPVPTSPPHHVPHSHMHSHRGMPLLNVGLVVPLKSFGLREYNRAVTTAITFLNRTGSRTRTLSIFQRHKVDFHMVMNSLTPTPTEHSRRDWKTSIYQN